MLQKFVSCLFLGIVLFLAACERPSLSRTGLRLIIDTSTKPSDSQSAQQKQAVLNAYDGGNAIDPSLLCFAVNINGQRIQRTNPASNQSQTLTSSPNPSTPETPFTCDVDRGIFKSLESNDALSVTVASGQTLKIELYGYLRTSTEETCPTDIETHWNWPLNKIYRIDSKNNISTDSANVDVVFQPEWPQSDQNIVVQNQWPKTCLPSPSDTAILSYLNPNDFDFDSVHVFFKEGKALLKPSHSFQFTDAETTFSNPSNGTFDKVQWSPSKSALILDHEAINNATVAYEVRPSGNYTSKVFDGGSVLQSWTHLGWVSRLPFGKPLPDTNESETPSNYSDLVDSNLMANIVGVWHMDNHNKALNATSVPGRFHVATHFSGSTNSYRRIPAPTSLPLGNTSRTVTAWIKADSPLVSTWGSIVNWGQGDCSNLMFGLGTQSAKLTIWGGCYDYDTGLSIPTNRWAFVAVAFDGTTVRAYVDHQMASQNKPNYNTQPSDLFIGGESINNSTIRASFKGAIDEVAIWSRALTDEEIRQIYRRGANRINFQVRVSDTHSIDSAVSPWLGADRSGNTSFSEIYNSLSNSLLDHIKTTFALMSFENFELTTALSTKRYFQYRVTLESDDQSNHCNYGTTNTWCSPELSKVMINEVSQYTNLSTVINTNALPVSNPTGFTEQLGTAGCPARIVYTLSQDRQVWNYWNGTRWTIADGSVVQTNSSQDLDTHIASFMPTSSSKSSLYIKAFLRSSGQSPCELSRIEVAQ